MLGSSQQNTAIFESEVVPTIRILDERTRQLEEDYQEIKISHERNIKLLWSLVVFFTFMVVVLAAGSENVPIQ